MIKYEIIVADDRVETIIPIAKFRFLPMNQLVIKVFCVKKTGTFTKAKIQLLTIIKGINLLYAPIESKPYPKHTRISRIMIIFLKPNLSMHIPTIRGPRTLGARREI